MKTNFMNYNPESFWWTLIEYVSLITIIYVVLGILI